VGVLSRNFDHLSLGQIEPQIMSNWNLMRDLVCQLYGLVIADTQVNY